MKNHALPRGLDAVVRVLRWHRRWFAALAAFLAVFTAIGAFQPDRTPTVAVLAAARDLPGGTTLSASDLLVVQLPADAVPGGSSAEASTLVGRVLNAPVTARSPLTQASVSTGAALARAGYVVIGVPLTGSALAGLIQVGSRVDLIASAGGPVASDVRVVATPSSAGSGMLSGPTSAVLLEVTPDAAARIAAALDHGALTIAAH